MYGMYMYVWYVHVCTVCTCMYGMYICMLHVCFEERVEESLWKCSDSLVATTQEVVAGTELKRERRESEGEGRGEERVKGGVGSGEGEGRGGGGERRQGGSVKRGERVCSERRRERAE